MDEETGLDRRVLPGLIAEVPAHLRHQAAAPPPGGHAVAPDPLDPAAPAPGRACVASGSPTAAQARLRAAPEERTRVRAGAFGPHLSALRQPTGVTVAAVVCPAGHFSSPEAPYCRSCGEAVPPQQPLRVPRPPLGSLHLPQGERVLLDRGAVLGRRPLPLPDGEPWPHLVELPADLTHLSRNHVGIELDGWHVLGRDLGSRGGTTLRAPGREPVRLRPHDPHVLEPGHSLVLADDFIVTYLVATG